MFCDLPINLNGKHKLVTFREFFVKFCLFSSLLFHGLLSFPKPLAGMDGHFYKTYQRYLVNMEV